MLQQSNVLDLLQIMLSAERVAGDLIKLDPGTIADAIERLADLESQIRLGNSALLHEYDSISDHLGTIVVFRSRKMTAFVGRGTPSNMVPAEAEFFESVSASVQKLRDAWGLTA